MRTFLYFKIITLILFATTGQAQFASSPISYRGKGEWSVRASMTYVDMDVDVQAISKRFLLQSTWGVTSWLDVKCTLGTSQLESSTGEQGVTDFNGKYRLAYGIGFNAYSHKLSNTELSFWGGFHVLRFPAKGSYTLIESEKSTRFQVEYDWREYKAYFGVIVPYRSIRFYIAGGVWKVQHLHKVKEYWVFGSSSSYIGSDEGEYRSDFWTGGIIGVEIQLPGRYAITLEAFGFNEHNYQIMFGLSQTGGFYW